MPTTTEETYRALPWPIAVIVRNTLEKDLQTCTDADRSVIAARYALVTTIMVEKSGHSWAPGQATPFCFLPDPARSEAR